jgi:fimbrial chaperone protein
MMISTAGFTAQAQAGVALGATRVIYPAGQKQVQLAVTNNDDSTYLIQSWVENADGAKDGRFVITPPLFAMQGKKENTLRIIDATNDQLPQDRETLFWMNVKAIPRWINQSSAITRCSWRLSAASSSITARQTGAAAGSGGGKAEFRRSGTRSR